MRPSARPVLPAPRPDGGGLAYHRRVSAPGLLANRDFRRLWIAQAISLFGDWFTYVAVGTLALSESTGLYGVAAVLVAHTLPRAVLAPFAGRLADRRDRGAILVVGSLLRALVVLVMIALVGDAGSGTAVLAGLVFLRMALSAFTDPAASAALPQLVPTHQLGSANALLGATWSTIFALGVAAGGFVTAFVGPRGALAIDAATFVLAAALFATLPRLRPGERSDASASASMVVTPDFLAAWRRTWRDPALLHVALAKIPVALANGGGWVLLHAVAGQQSAVAVTLGVMHGVRGIGTGVGPLLWARVGRLRGTISGIHLGTAVTLAGVALFSAFDLPALLVVASVLWGLGMGATWVTSTTRLQLLTPNALLGRLAAIDLMAHTCAQCLGGLLGAVVADALLAPAGAGWFGAAGGLLAWGLLVLLVRARARRSSQP
ncbi:MFS transporter [Nannocystis punicea]|uniref:MFS transporter n=1 Tax=Nannocystis punicea TaxID=2995304 RepID=A0ABY7HDK2_9BACT|nr:MFS transporter [Nannocystis poenicansa]WAS97276.1 MFS transporter [Nannocystis poenicansa]